MHTREQTFEFSSDLPSSLQTIGAWTCMQDRISYVFNSYNKVLFDTAHVIVQIQILEIAHYLQASSARKLQL